MGNLTLIESAVRAGVWPWHARAGNALVLGWLRRRTGLLVRDIAPMRVCRREDRG